MSIQCPRCGYVRKENEDVPDWQCPACGVAYNKIISHVHHYPIICPHCGYARTGSEGAPDWQCPACGIALNKIVKNGRYIDDEMEQKHLEIEMARKQLKNDSEIIEEIHKRLYWSTFIILAAVLLIAILHNHPALQAIGFIIMGLSGLPYLNKMNTHETFSPLGWTRSKPATKKEQPINFYGGMGITALYFMLMILYGVWRLVITFIR
jgi:ribosomal protein L37AE/L43A